VASIMDEFISILEKENKVYQKMVELSSEKTTAIIYAKIDDLNRITEAEQAQMEDLMKLEKERIRIRDEMSKILKVPAESLTLLSMANMFEKRPTDKQKLLDLRERLRLTLIDVAKVNKENEGLLKQSMEMLEYDMNLIRSTRVAPTTANYNKDAYSAETILPGGGFNVTQ